MLALPIFPARLQASIFGAGELNFRVRDGNGWTLAAISTNLLSFEKESKQRKLQRTFLSLPSFSTVSYYIQFLTRCQGKNTVKNKNEEQIKLLLVCVGTTYFPSPSPGKYLRQKRA